MLSHEVHRGPDSAGVWSSDVCGRGVAVGLRRLRILDLSEAADQPMVSRDGRYALVFNGEIYNYLELRARLEKEGVTFRTHGDTEVLLESLTRWGSDALNELNGMWALVLIDTVSGEALLARDRFGVKPLYYHSDGRSLWLASEVKVILASAGWTVLRRSSGSHEQWISPDGNQRVTIASGGKENREVPVGTLSRIRRMTGLEELR